MALKLVIDNDHMHTNESSTDRKIRTFYYHSANDRHSEPAKHSKAKTLNGAVRAAVMRVINSEYDMVRVYHDDGHFMASIMRKTSRNARKQQIEIFGWFGSL